MALANRQTAALGLDDVPSTSLPTGQRPGAAPRLSVVIPAYNESRRIATSLQAIRAYLAAQPFGAEIVVVDDGSTDDTFAVIRAAAGDGAVPLRAFRYGPNGGKGWALKCGIAQARGDRILFTDADLSTPIDEAARLLAQLEEGADIAIGSRKMAGARVLVHQPWIRERLGRGFTWLVRRLIADVSDATCGFKAFTRAAAHDIFGRVRIYDWSFDAEVLALAHHLGYRVDEVPVAWEDRAGTKVHILRDAARSFYGLLRIRANVARGAYRVANPPPRAGEVWESSVAVSTPAG